MFSCDMDSRLISKRPQCLLPSRLPLLVLIKNLCVPEKDDELVKCIGRLRHGVSLLLLELIQAPDLDPALLPQHLMALDNQHQLYSQLIKRLSQIVADGIEGLLDFFYSLDDLFAGKEPALQKTSLFGIFMRRHTLLFHKMTFSQVGHLFKLFENYVAAVSLGNEQGKEEIQHQSIDISDISMESLSVEDAEKGTNQPVQFREKSTVSSQQAGYFLAQQASCLQCNESAALNPPDLQAKIAALLASSPDIAEAHYVSYLNSARVNELNTAMDSLYRYYEKQQWSSKAVLIGSLGVKTEESDEEKCRRFRYAALNLASLHCQFSHKEEAIAALKEAIQITQETSDHVCLEHCLGWLLRLENNGNHHSKALLERYVARAAELKLPYLMSLSLLTHTKYGCMDGMSPPKLFQELARVDVINAQNSLEDLTAIAHAQYTSIWYLYGKRQIAGVFSQLCPGQLQNPAGARFEVWVNKPGSAFTGEQDLTRGLVHNQDGEALCLSLCQLAQIHMDQGMFTEAVATLSYLGMKFPKYSKHSQLGLMTHLKLKYRRAMLESNWRVAEEVVHQMKPINKLEAEYRLAVLMICREQYLQSYALLDRLLEETRDKLSINEGKRSAIEYQTSLLLAMSQLFIATDSSVSALPHLLKCLTMSSSHFMDDMTAKATLHIAYVQLMNGRPTQAQTLVKSIMVQILSHGCLLLQCSAQFLLVKCQLANAQGKARKSGLHSALQTLDKVLSGFVKLQAKSHITDVLYHKCMIYDELGCVSERNQCSKECCDFLESEKSGIAPILFCFP